MVLSTREGEPLTREQFIALYTIHGIFGAHYDPGDEEIDKLDWELLETPEFIKDVFEVIESLPTPCSEIFVMYFSGKRYKQIGKELNMTPVAVQEHLHKAWRLLWHPKRSKAISHYMDGFREFERRLEEEFQ